MTTAPIKAIKLTSVAGADVYKRQGINDSENRSSPGGDNFCRIYCFLGFAGTA